MAGFLFNYSALNSRPPQNDGLDNTELHEIPRSIASSAYTSRYNAIGADDADEYLLKQAHSTSYATEKGNGAYDVVETVASQTPSFRANRERKGRLKGWRFGVTMAACAALLVMLINLLLAIAAAVKFRHTLQSDGIGTAYEGDCSVVDEWSTALHVIINVLSSVLLSASNYTMQCLSSPTRKEVDSAHKKGDWLDIGLPSVRNIWGRINTRRILLWWILALSSAPIHLLYNSSAFQSLDANLYSVLVVNRDFLEGQPFSAKIMIYDAADNIYPANESHEYRRLRKIQSFFSNNYLNTSAVQKLSNEDCINAYGTAYVSGRSDVLLITDAQGEDEYHTFFYDTETDADQGGVLDLSYTWICEDLNNPGCDLATVRRNSNWTVNTFEIDHCLSRLQPPRCKLQFSLAILAIVIAMNFCKCVSMFWTVFWQKSPTLVTVGDALASFLDSPDPLTGNRCLMSKADMDRGPLQWHSTNTRPPAIAYHPVRRRWFTAASIKRWIITMSLCMSALIVAAALLATGIKSFNLNDGERDPFQLGFGKVDPKSLIDAGLPTSLVGAVFIANLPQLILSFLYLTYNGLLTNMLLSNEWAGYFLRPKSLRTTTPRGAQRSTYWLQLPYKYSVPLLVAMATLHWLLSESIFLARLDLWQDGALVESSSEVGYSCLPLLCVISLGAAMLIAAFVLGFRRFSSCMPVVGSCSVAISAACHRPKNDIDAAFLPVSWGEVDRDDPADDVLHCCFTSYPARELIAGQLYAGERHGVDT